MIKNNQNLSLSVVIPVYNRKDLFKNLLLIDKEVRKVLTEKEIVKQFDFNYHTKQINNIFKRVFKV